jgi:hypothetical protein
VSGHECRSTDQVYFDVDVSHCYYYYYYLNKPIG